MSDSGSMSAFSSDDDVLPSGDDDDVRLRGAARPCCRFSQLRASPIVDICHSFSMTWTMTIY